MKRAFTLAETIMTLVVIVLVVSAAIPVFTIRNTAGSNDENTAPWNYCDTNNRRGLCTRENISLNFNRPGEKFQYRYNGQDLYYDFSLSENSLRHNIFGMIISDTPWIQVGQRNFMLSRNNLIMSRLNFRQAILDPIGGTSDNNILLGDSAITGSNNIVIGNTPVNGSNNIVLNNIPDPNNNTITGNGSVVIGENINTGAGSIVIGNNNTNTTQNAVIIGSNIGNAAAGNVLNIGGVITAAAGSPVNFVQNAPINFSGQFNPGAPGHFNSDARLKNIKGTYTKGLKEILQVEPVLYNFKNEKGVPAHTGVIAQDLQKIFPEAVVVMPNGYYGVTTDPIFFAMLNSVKEINKKTLEEEKKQQKLEKEMNDLINEIETLSACKADNGFWGKIKCFFFDVKMFFKDLFGRAISNHLAICPRYPEFISGSRNIEVKYEKA